jgi:hypothetical protein
MNRYYKLLVAITILVAGVAAFAPAPNAGSEHFVITNDHTDNNKGTLLKLAGTARDPVLNQVAPLNTHVPDEEFGYVPDVLVVRFSTDVCVFLTNGTYDTSNEVSAFKYPSNALVKNYTNIHLSYTAGAVAASGGYLYVNYGDAMGSWAIGSGCTLHLVRTSPVNIPQQAVVEGMAVTPDGKTLVLSAEAGPLCCVDSFSIGPNGTLTEQGPYHVHASSPLGMDITADSAFAIFGSAQNCMRDCTASPVVVFPINSNGSLGVEQDFYDDGPSVNGPQYVRLSPDEKYLYVSTGSGVPAQVATLNFSENPLNISYAGCTTTLKSDTGTAYSMATVTPTGTGGGLYVAEESRVGLLTINPATGCTSEAPSSPFSGVGPFVSSVAAWPPRPF